ncbi:hypothetical protein GGS20DRAFT_585395 [Poronia punctata]|nr:hypothetical protein GGS20DRAFT_585395 [Poronia punctata]
MADHPRRGGRSRPDSKGMRDESEQRNRYGGGARDRRDDRDRYRDDTHRHRDRRQRSRSRSPVGDRRDPRDRRDRDRDRDRGGLRGDDSTRERPGNRRQEWERDDRRRDEYREGDITSRSRRTDHRRSTSPRSPLRDTGHAKHTPYSPLPTRSKHATKPIVKSSVRGEPYDEDSSQASNFANDNEVRNHLETNNIRDEKRGRRLKANKDGGEDAMDEDNDLAVEDDEMSAMQAMMGFGGFGTTKGQKVPGNNSGAVYKAKKTEYRQYMNRIGGFNRPLSPGR